MECYGHSAFRPQSWPQLRHHYCPVESAIIKRADTAIRKRPNAILPRGEMEEDLAFGKLKIVRIAKPTIYRTLFIAWSNERPNTPQMKAVQNIARRETAEIIRKGAWGTKFLS